MLEMVEARGQANKVEQRHDLFNGLLDAVQDELDTGGTISEEELIGGYSMSHRLEFFLEMQHSRFQETCSYFFLPDMRWDLHVLLCAVIQKPLPYRLQHIRYASHLPCWLSIRMSKSACINTSRV